eukprot:3105609-Amphidinium_carterae.1
MASMIAWARILKCPSEVVLVLLIQLCSQVTWHPKGKRENKPWLALVNVLDCHVSSERASAAWPHKRIQYSGNARMKLSLPDASCPKEEQERAWALYSDNSAGGQEPLGDMCAECYGIHQAAFSFLSWSDFCEKVHNNEDDYAAKVKKARSVKAGLETAGEPQSVYKDVQLGLELRRSFIAVSEKELRKSASLYRLPKLPFKNIPQVKAPAEDGSGEELLYLFRDEQQPSRRAELKMFIGIGWQRVKMSQGNQLWANQGEAMCEHLAAEQAQAWNVMEA